MPLTESLGASLLCLRCQLRRVILHTRLQAPSRCYDQRVVQTCRGFSTTRARCQEGEDEDEGVFLKSNGSEDERRKRYRREYPLGRIIGRPGRRQRERSETLKMTSMKRPFDVVLMQDIRQVKDEPPIVDNTASEVPDGGSTITAAQVARELLNRDGTPSQDEVDASIDALRPSADIVNEQQLQSLKRQLADGYTTQQLSIYLEKFRLHPNGSAGDPASAVGVSNRKDLHLSTSEWRPGSTPIERKHAVISHSKKESGRFGKKRITEQILTDAWNLSVLAEEEEIGELEVALKSWQFRYLFELGQNSKLNYEHMIQSQLLLRRSEIVPYASESRIRISARRQDAEEIVHLIQEELRQVDSIEVDLRAFRPMLGKPGWPKTLKRLFPQASLKHVGQHALCVIEPTPEKTLRIYNKSASAREHAKRLLLSLLHLPSPTWIETFYMKDEDNAKRGIWGSKNLYHFPEYSESSLHFRDRGLRLSRLRAPISKKTENSEPLVVRAMEFRDHHDPKQSTLAAALVSKLSELKLSKHTGMLEQPGRQGLLDNRVHTEHNRNTSYWHEKTHFSNLPWTAQICKIVNSRAQPAQSIIQTGIPGINTLLSYFEPSADNNFAFDTLPTPPYLIAHFLPSPFTTKGIGAMQDLPRIELWYQLASSPNNGQSAETRGLRLIHVQAILDQQELRVTIPDKAVDLRFLRKLPLTAHPARLMQDADIAQFSEILRKSVVHSTGALAGQSSVKFKMPAWIASAGASEERRDARERDFEVDYLFECFEQAQTAAFVPPRGDRIPAGVDPAMKQTLDSLPDSAFLEYKAIEGGIMGGNRSELTVKCNDDTQREGALNLVEAALSIAAAVTRIDAGEIGSMQASTDGIEEES